MTTPSRQTPLTRSESAIAAKPVPPRSADRRPLQTERPSPLENPGARPAREIENPSFIVDLRRCIGCHACSVACKTAHGIPLGEFPLRVRWLPRPDEKTYAFVPVFSESRCSNDPESLEVGMDPACTRACPTDALIFGDAKSPSPSVQALEAKEELQTLSGPEATDLKDDVRYIGLEPFVSESLHQGAALDPRDEDPIYEQR